MDIVGRGTRRWAAGKTGLTRWLCLGAVLAASAAAPVEREQYEVVFEGRPGKRVVIGYTEARWTVLEERLNDEDSEEYLVRIVRDRRGNYFWASRKMRPMVKEESGGFVTWSAGAYGYVKTFKKPFLDMQRGVFDPGHEYMEHVINVLYSVNYWGTRTDY